MTGEIRASWGRKQVKVKVCLLKEYATARTEGTRKKSYLPHTEGCTPLQILISSDRSNFSYMYIMVQN